METELTLTDSHHLREVIEDADGRCQFRNPGVEGVQTIIEMVRENGTENLPERLDILGTRGVVRKATKEFIDEVWLAEAVNEGQMRIKTETYDSLQRVPQTFTTPDGVAMLVDDVSSDGVIGFYNDDLDIIESLRDTFEEAFANADGYHLRTPGYGEIEASMRDRLSDKIFEEFDRSVRTAETARGGQNGESLDGTALALLVCAKNKEMFYDVSRWGEDVELASKATFSRVKNQLEDAGLLTTEGVRQPVGRPRQRLCLVDERLQNADPSALVSAATTVLN